MKAHRFNIPMLHNQPLRIVKEEAVNFYAHFHYHEEVQISLINRGSGTLLLGHQIQNFKEGAIIVIGKDIPHLMQKASSMHQPVSCTSLYFKESLFGLDTLYANNLRDVKAFFTDLKRGLLVSGRSATRVSPLIDQCLSEKHILGQLASVLRILNGLMQVPDKVWLNVALENAPEVYMGNNRMEKVINFTLGHLKEKISVARAAREINLSESRFSRVFKQHTGLTYIAFLNKLRVEDACAQLLHTKNNISEIAYSSGFENISNFNKVFKQLKGQTPTAFRNRVSNFSKYAD